MFGFLLISITTRSLTFLCVCILQSLLLKQTLRLRVLSLSSGSSSTGCLCSEWLSSQSVKNGRSVVSYTPGFTVSTWHPVNISTDYMLTPTQIYCGNCVFTNHLLLLTHVLYALMSSQVSVCGLCFLILFAGNFFTTVAVVRQKLKSRNQKPKSLWCRKCSNQHKCSCY